MPGNRGSVIYAQYIIFRLLVLLVCASVIPTTWAQQASVRSELSASTITRDETVVLTITAVGIDAELDASSLNRNFDVVGRSSSREMRTISNSANQITSTSVVTWALELLPRDVGVFTVPAVKVGSLSTQLLSLTVNEVPQGAKRDVFIEATVDTSEPWVQSQVVMTVSIFQAVDIVDGGLDVPSSDDLVVERIGEDTRNRQIRDGREYSVTERRFALFAQKSGVLQIDPITLSVTVPADPALFRGFFSPTRKLTRRTQPITLNVQPRSDTGSAWWLPAKNVRFESQWATPPENAQVDKPLTRTIVMRVEGVQDSQLPDIRIPTIEGVSLYAEEPQRSTGTTANGLVSEQKINWALIPQRSGSVTLPAISIQWFNTETGQTQTAILPEERITVATNASATPSTGTEQSQTANTAGVASDEQLAGESLATNTASDPLVPQVPVRAEDDVRLLSEDAENDGLVGAHSAGMLSQRVASLESSLTTWRLLALVAVALWLVTGLYYLLHRRQAVATTEGLFGRGAPVSGKSLQALTDRVAPLSAVEKACKAQNLTDIKTALLEWSARQWPDNAPKSLQALSQRLPGNEPGNARETITQLDGALYGQAGLDEADSGMIARIESLPGDLKAAVRLMSTSETTSTSGRRDDHKLPELE